MNPEVALISSVCRTKDAGILFKDIEELFVSHGAVWKSLKDYYTSYKSVPDAVTLIEEHKFFAPVKTTGETAHYLDKLRNEWLKRKMNTLFTDLNSEVVSGEKAAQDVLRRLISQASRLDKVTSEVRDLDITDYETAADDYAARKRLSDERGGSAGIPFGIERLDKGYPTGLAPGHFIVYIGWSGHGKSWFATLSACNAFTQGYTPMIISLEMSPETVRDRIYTVLGSGAFKNTDLVRGDIGPEQVRTWGKEALSGKQKFHVVATDSADSVRPATIAAKIEEYKPDIVFLDYAQLFDDNRGSDSMTNRMMNVSREFKLMAIHYGIPIVLLTQATMSDKSDVNTPPMIEQVAWSKSIQNDADLALAVHKFTGRNTFQVIARKNRHGPDFGTELEWDLNTGEYTVSVPQVHESEEWKPDAETY